jgi:type II secretory pathway pseudopilin PulG
MFYLNKRRCTGMTLIEASISVGIFGVVSVFVAMITLAVAKQSSSAMAKVPNDQQVYRTIEHIRRELLPAQYTSLMISADKKSVDFFNPARGTDARIYFDDNSKKCVMVPDLTDLTNELVCGRNLTGSFEMVDSGRMIQVTASTTVTDYTDQPFSISYQDDLRVRN